MVENNGSVEYYRTVVSEVEVEISSPRDPVFVRKYPNNWRCVGVGTSAAVFQPFDNPGICIKVFSKQHSHIAQEEARVYQSLGESRYFPRFYGQGEGFLVIQYRPGINVYDCLVQGIYISPQVVEDVETAITYAKERGLCPADIHAKNILVYEGRGFLIDVSDYGKGKLCKRWENLKYAYHHYYQELYKPGFTVPSWVLETIRKWYKGRQDDGSITNFADNIIKMFFA